MQKRNFDDLFFALGFIAIAVYVWMDANRVAGTGVSEALTGPDFWLRILSILLMVLAIVLGGNWVASHGIRKIDEKKPLHARLITAMVLTGAYPVVLIKYLTFGPASFVYILLFAHLFEKRGFSWRWTLAIAGLSLLMTVSLLVVFVRLLKVQLP